MTAAKAEKQNLESGEYLDGSKEGSTLLKNIIGSTKANIKNTVDYRYVLMDFLSKDKELTEVILRGNSLDAQDNTGKTLLMHIVINGCNIKLVRYLLDRGVDKDIADSEGNKAYDLAVIHRRSELLEILR